MDEREYDLNERELQQLTRSRLPNTPYYNTGATTSLNENSKVDPSQGQSLSDNKPHSTPDFKENNATSSATSRSDTAMPLRRSQRNIKPVHRLNL